MTHEQATETMKALLGTLYSALPAARREDITEMMMTLPLDFTPQQFQQALQQRAEY
jgi:hypothetical protein